MIKIYICDDDIIFLEQIKNAIKRNIEVSKYGDFNYEIKSFSDPSVALQRCSEDKPNIVFLDIDMPEVNGFNIAKNINDSNSNTTIIFISSHDNYVYTSLRFKPFRFIRKSHIKSELHEALKSSLNEIFRKEKFIELGSKYFNERIFFADIVYLESKRNYAEISTVNGRKLMYRSTLSKLEDELCKFDFVRIHSAFLVNMKYIKRIDHDTVELATEEKIRISRRLHSQLISAYSKYMRG